MQAFHELFTVNLNNSVKSMSMLFITVDIKFNPIILVHYEIIMNNISVVLFK